MRNRKHRTPISRKAKGRKAHACPSPESTARAASSRSFQPWRNRLAHSLALPASSLLPHQCQLRLGIPRFAHHPPFQGYKRFARREAMPTAPRQLSAWLSGQVALADAPQRPQRPFALREACRYRPWKASLLRRGRCMRFVNRDGMAWAGALTGAAKNAADGIKDDMPLQALRTISLLKRIHDRFRF